MGERERDKEREGEMEGDREIGSRGREIERGRERG